MKSYTDFVNESKRVDEALLKKGNSYVGGICYSFEPQQLDPNNTIEWCELSAAKGSIIIDSLPNYKDILEANVTYVTCLVAADDNEFEYMFNVKEWYKIIDFIKKSINEGKKSPSNPDFKLTKDELKIELIEVNANMKQNMILSHNSPNILWIIKTKNETFKMKLTPELINELLKIKFN